MAQDDSTNRPGQPDKRSLGTRPNRPKAPKLPKLPSLESILGVKLPPGVDKALNNLADSILDNLAKEIIQEEITELKARACATTLNAVADNWWRYLILKGCAPRPANDEHPAQMIDAEGHPMLFAGVGGRYDQGQDAAPDEVIPFFLLAIYDQECIDAAKATLIEIYERRSREAGKSSTEPYSFFANLERQMNDHLDKGGK